MKSSMLYGLRTRLAEHRESIETHDFYVFIRIVILCLRMHFPKTRAAHRGCSPQFLKVEVTSLHELQRRLTHHVSYRVESNKKRQLIVCVQLDKISENLKTYTGPAPAMKPKRVWSGARKEETGRDYALQSLTSMRDQTAAGDSRGVPLPLLG